MVSKKILALAALSLVSGSTAASAQSRPAVEPCQCTRGPARRRRMRDENDFLRRSGWILGMLALGILVFVVVEANKDHPLPDSP